MRVVGRFSWHDKPGDFAEQYFHNKYFHDIGLSFRKIRKDKVGKKPDGYILDRGRKIALAEIKLIKRQERGTAVQIITIDGTIRRAIRKAKEQLKTIDDGLPKIIYLIGDDTFFKPKSLRAGIFGKYVTDRQGFTNHMGFYPKYKEYDNLRDGLISAIICYIHNLEGYNLWTYVNRSVGLIPLKILDKAHLEELWEYSPAKYLKKINQK